MPDANTLKKLARKVGAVEKGKFNRELDALVWFRPHTILYRWKAARRRVARFQDYRGSINGWACFGASPVFWFVPSRLFDTARILRQHTDAVFGRLEMTSPSGRRAHGVR